MIIRSAEFVVSNTDVSKCPKPGRPEFAFIGRSNVGKSSLINLLANHKGLAKTSSTPGKTQMINHFLINGEWFVVDLPGYGYSAVSRSQSAPWGRMIEQYLSNRESLMTTFVLLDPRLEPQKIDQEFVHWMGEQGIPFSLVFTKADKLSKNHLLTARRKWEESLQKTWAELPQFFATSSHSRLGRDELLDYIESLLSKD